MNAQPYVGRWHSDEGFFTAIVQPNGKTLRLLTIDHPMRLRKVPASEARYITPLDYPLKRAVGKMRRFARNNSGKGVRRFLDGVLA